MSTLTSKQNTYRAANFCFYCKQGPQDHIGPDMECPSDETCEWCDVGIPLSTDRQRHNSIYGVWACRAPGHKSDDALGMRMAEEISAMHDELKANTMKANERLEPLGSQYDGGKAMGPGK